VPLILVVDDDTSFLDLMKKKLEVWEFEVRQAENVDKAIKHLNERKPDLVICDVMMPNEYGPFLRNYMLNHDEFKETPFLFVTALDDDMAKMYTGKKMMETTAHMGKPINFELLKNKIDKLLAS